MQKKIIAAVLFLAVLVTCVTACEKSAVAQENSGSKGSANVPSPKKTPVKKNAEGKIGVELIKEVRCVTPGFEEMKIEFTRDEYGNTVECKETDVKTGKIAWVKFDIEDERQTNSRYKVRRKNSISREVILKFTAEDKLKEISYSGGPFPYEFTRYSNGSEQYVVTQDLDVRKCCDYYNAEYKLIKRTERDDSGEIKEERIYNYDGNGFIVSVDVEEGFGGKAYTEEYCEAGHPLGGEACGVEYDDSGNIIKEHHGNKEYSYEFDGDGNLIKAAEFAAEGSDCTATCTYSADGSLETVKTKTDAFEQIITYDTFYVEDDPLLLFFLSCINKYAEAEAGSIETYYCSYS